MDGPQKERQETLFRVRGYLDDFAGSLGDINRSLARVSLDRLVSELEGLAGYQQHAPTEAQSRAVQKEDLREALRLENMQPIAAVGLYGVVSYVMVGRTREFGVRLALGASPSSITRLVLGYGMRLSMIGGAAGMILGLGALRLIGGMLFGSWSSVPIAAGVAFGLCAVTLVACAIPAFRAAAISPAGALRSE